MTKYVNKVELIDTLFRGYTTEEFEDNIGEIITKEIIEMLPTIDIVHCKECIHEDIGMCSHIDHEWERHEADYFCADGERKPALKHADKETLQSAT